MNLKFYPEPKKEILKRLSDFPKIVTTILINRGITSKAQAEKYLNPNLDNLQSPFDLAEINTAIERIVMAKNNNEKIYIYGDYDVDGVTATSLLWDFLYRKLNINVMPFIPSRFEEGYGLSESGIETIIKDGAKLIITVDCGIRDIELIEKYHKQIDFIITDHHTVSENENNEKIISDKAIATIHPKHPDSKFKFKEICGAAVAWKLVNGIYEFIIEKDIVDLANFHPNEYLDLVALATVTDIMPLQEENRIILKHGLETTKITKNLGLRTLMLNSQIEPDSIDTYHFGFVIGPRINAAGRIETALDAVRLLSTRKLSEASKFSDKLNRLNTHRQKITQEILETARNQILETQDIENDKLLFTWGDKWPEGVVGLVAGKLQEEFYRPILVATIHNGIATGSARSIPEFDVTEAISRSSELLERFGGHVQAAGFTLKAENLEKFKRNLIMQANEEILKDHLIKEIRVDMRLDINEISFKLLNELSKLKPFGLKNPTPTFYFEGLEIFKKYLIGKDKNHVKLIFKNDHNENIEMLGFNKVEEFHDLDEGDKIDIVGSIDKNVWNGRETLQIKFKDFRKSL